MHWFSSYLKNSYLIKQLVTCNAFPPTLQISHCILLLFFPFFSESKHDVLLQNYSSNAKLKRFYRVLTTNTDGKEEFISTMEGMNATEHLFVYMCDIRRRPTVIEVCMGSKLKPEPGPYPRSSDPTRPDPSGTVKFRARTRPEITPRPRTRPTTNKIKKGKRLHFTIACKETD